MSILDRYIFRSLLLNYFIGLGVMLSLYVALDMFVNMDEFLEADLPWHKLAGVMGDYYGPNLLLYFSQLSGIITLFACGAVLARMRKLHEMTAILASGVSLYRVARPVLVFAVLMTGLLVLDTEVLIPSLAHKLARDHDDVAGDTAYEVLFQQDRGGALLSAGRFHPREKNLHRLLVLFPAADGSLSSTLEADRAVWEPNEAGVPGGRWRLDRGRMIRRVFAPHGSLGPREAQEIAYPSIYESDLDPAALQTRQAGGWVRFLSLGQLKQLENAQSAELREIVQTRHVRIAAPIISLLLVLLGIPFFLDRSPGNVLSDAGKCTLVCGLCYVAAFLSQSMRLGTESALPVWVPIFIFGPLAIVLLDRVRT
jgi:lipopolysaccharide export system permease protein